MFVVDDDYTLAVKDVLEAGNKRVVYMAVAFWGRGADSLFNKLPTGTDIRIVCNLASGGTNPDVIRELLGNWAQISVRQMNTLHAKVMCGDALAVVGSANCSTNGLALEGTQCAGWVEAGTVIRDKNTVTTQIRPWLESLWDQARDISDADLESAEINFKKRRNVFPRKPASEPVSGLYDTNTKAYWKDKKVYLAIYCTESTPEADEIFESHQAQISEGLPSPIELDFYQDWPRLPKDDALLVDVWYHPSKPTINDVCYRRQPRWDKKFKSRAGKMTSLQILVPELANPDFPFGSAQAKQVKKKLLEPIGTKTRIQHFWDNKPKGHDSVVVPYSELFDK